MKLIVERAALVAALDATARLADAKAVIAVLSHLRLSTLGNELSIDACDLDAYITATAPAEVVAGGSAALPASALRRIVKAMPDGAQISIEIGAAQATVRSGRARYVLPAMDAGEYPEPFTTGAGASYFTLSALDVARLGRAVHAASRNDKRANYYDAVFIHGPAIDPPGPRTLTSVATDGYVALAFAAPLPDGAEAMPLESQQIAPGVVLPSWAVDQIVRIGKDGVELEVGRTVVVIISGRVRYASKLVEGAYPDYRRIIPALAESYVELDRDTLASALRRLSEAAGDVDRGVEITWGGERVGLRLEDKSASVAGAEEIEMLGQSGAGVVGAKVSQLAMLVEQIGGARIAIHSDNRAHVTRLRDPDNPGATAIVAPKAIRVAADAA